MAHMLTLKTLTMFCFVQTASSLWPKRKRGKAMLLISTVWLLPLVLIIVVSVSWNCLDKCVCHSAYYPKQLSCQAGKLVKTKC